MEIGTTPTHTFNIPPDVCSKIKEIKIVYSQDDKVVLEKRLGDCTVEDGKVIVRLTQKETFLFDYTKLAFIQMRILTEGNDCFKSNIMVEPVGKCLDEEVLE